MHPNNLTQTKALEFMLSGNAIFTVLSQSSGNRYTFKVAIGKKNPNYLYVGLLNGSDNLNDYAPMCYIDITGGLPAIKRSSKTWISTDAPSYICFNYVFMCLLAGVEMPKVEIWHEGRCGRCGRLLTVPESIESGIGPECAKREQKIAL